MNNYHITLIFLFEKDTLPYAHEKYVFSSLVFASLYGHKTDRQTVVPSRIQVSDDGLGFLSNEKLFHNLRIQKPRDVRTVAVTVLPLALRNQRQ